MGMFVVARDVDGASFAGLHEHAVGTASFLVAAGVVVGHAGDAYLGAFCVGNAKVPGVAVTTRHGRQRGGGPQQAQEVPAGQACGRFRGSWREFVADARRRIQALFERTPELLCGLDLGVHRLARRFHAQRGEIFALSGRIGRG